VNINDFVSDKQKAEMPKIWSQMEKHFGSLGKAYFDVLFATACWLKALNVRANKDKFFIGISGGQGSGKSTFSNLLSLVFTELFDLKTLVMSLDDFYLTHDERQVLAKTVHPLLKTRGVPGTHDIPLMGKVMGGISHNKEVHMPAFDKSDDDRCAMTKVRCDDVKIIIVEGWCWGAEPESDTSVPLNQLEREQDADGLWRGYVNQQLANYQDLFRTDTSIFLSIPSMSSVLEWRWQQESELGQGSKNMTKEDIEYFVMHYERLTRHMLQSMPGKVDLTLYLDKDHHFDKAILE
jgi:D-glycerate 3-kinase